jgi:hypothetical protein
VVLLLERFDGIVGNEGRSNRLLLVVGLIQVVVTLAAKKLRRFDRQETHLNGSTEQQENEHLPVRVGRVKCGPCSRPLPNIRRSSELAVNTGHKFSSLIRLYRYTCGNNANRIPAFLSSTMS